MCTFLRTAFCIACLGFSSQSFALYETEISLAQQWLTAQQNADGSWGTLDTEKFISTVETVSALRASGLRNDAYYRGVTWLENHVANNVDYASRRAVSLTAHGDNVSGPLISLLDNAQDSAVAGRSGWGIADQYLQSPIDTAIALSGLAVVGTSSGSNAVTVQPTLDYLKAVQLASNGWPVGESANSDALSTALIIKGLEPWQSLDSSLATPIANAVSYLQSAVSISDSIYLQALAAHAALVAGDNAAASPWLTQLHNTQAGNGSWSGGRVYDAALALRVFAAADGLDTSASQSTVSVPDANLRAAVNAALGRGALDRLSCGEMAQLTSLVASNLSINDLTGLECATSLTTLDVGNNNITSTGPIDGLAQLTTLLIAGNPVAGGGGFDSDEDIPTLPEWGMIIMACLLLWQLMKQQRERDNNPTQFDA